MKIVLDTNVIIDTMLQRPDFVKDSSAVMQTMDNDILIGAVTANTLTDIYYILRKNIRREELKQSMRNLISMLRVLPVTIEECSDALDSSVADFEDAVLVCCAAKWGADYIVTRDSQDFAVSSVKAVSPAEFLSLFEGDINEQKTKETTR